MNAETIFSFANYLAMIGWLLMVLAPRWNLTQKIGIAGIIPGLLAALYLYLIVTYFGKSEGGLGSLEEVRLPTSNDYALLAGWEHYLGF